MYEVDFFISELTNTYREGMIIARPSQLFEIFKLLNEKVPNIKYTVTVDSQPSYSSAFGFDEGQLFVHLTWEGEFPGTNHEVDRFLKCQ